MSSSLLRPTRKPLDFAQGDGARFPSGEVESALANVYFDTAASPLLYGPRIFEVGARLVGARKILLGSDFPLVRARRLLAQIDRAELSDEDKTGIAGGNAATLLAGGT